MEEEKHVRQAHYQSSINAIPSSLCSAAMCLALTVRLTDLQQGT